MMGALTLFGFAAVGFTLLCYVLEDRSPRWVLGFAAGSLASAAYGFLQGAWPFGVVELVWTVAGLRRWRRTHGNRSLDTAFRRP